MANPLFRLFRTIWYKVMSVFGVVDKKLRMDPGVVGQKYDRHIDTLKNDIDKYMDAISSIMSLNEKKKLELKKTEEKIKDLTQKKAGAFKLAQKRTEELTKKGMSPEEIRIDPEVVKFSGYYRDFTSSLQREIERIEELQVELKQSTDDIEKYKLQLLELKRKVEKLKEEKAQAVADVITTKQEVRMNKMIAGLSTNVDYQELEDIRQDISEYKNKAKLTRIVAGTEGKLDEAAMKEAGRSSEAEDEFFDMLLGSKKTDKKGKTTETKLPE
jgi:phage shock protein A